MHEIWNRWEPVNNLAKKYYIESITERIDDKFKILLSDAEDEKKKVLISFPHGVDAHRNTNESYILSTLTSLKTHYGTEFYSDWTFFKVENSEYLKWISEQSYGIYEDCKFTHFCILAVDSMVDIITNYEPTVTFLD